MPLYRNFVDFVSNQVIGGIKNFTQNLGLGISSPQAKLHIDAGDATASAIKFTAGATTGTSATDGFDIGISSIGIASINQRLNANLNLATNGSNRLTISGGGIVTLTSTQASTASNNGALVLANGGLGVAGQIFAGNNINISKSGVSGADLIISSNAGGTTASATSTTASSIALSGSGGAGNEGMNARITATYESVASALGTKLSFFTRAASFGTLNENMVLKANGNLLLGTITDNNTDKLQVAGSLNASIAANSTVFSISQNTGGTARTLTFGADGLICNTLGTFGRSTIISGTTLGLSTAIAGRIGTLIQGVASQTADLQQWLNSAGTVLSRVDASGIITAPQFRLTANNIPPVSVADAGTAGEIRIDSNFIYYCHGVNQWKRAALSAW